jgi:hypothetical protein
MDRDRDIASPQRAKNCGIVFLWAALFLLIQPSRVYPAPAEWIVEEVITDDIDTVHLGTRAFRTIAVDGSCQPHTFYRDTTKKLKYAYRNASGWHIETVFTGDASLYKGQIAIDSMDHPGMTICTTAAGAFKQRKYVHWTGSNWEVMNICEFDTGRGHNVPSLAFDSNDNPHGVNYMHTGGGISHRSHHTWYDGEWHTEVVPSQREMRSSGITIDGNDVIHLCYFDTVQDFNNPTVEKLAYLKKEGDNWSTYTHIKSFTPWVLQEGIGGKGAIGVAVDSADRPHMIYSHRHTEGSEDVIKLYYCGYTGTEWMDEIIDPDIGSAGSMPSLSVPVIDSEDYIHFVYQTSSNKIKYAMKKGDDALWEITTLATNGRWPSMAIDSNGERYVVYEDTSTNKLMFLSTVPEPGTLILLGAGLAGLTLWMALRRKKGAELFSEHRK